MSNLISLDHTSRSELITCPRKYYLSNIKHIKSQYGSPALRYGIAWHAAMEGFYTVIAEKGWGAMAEGMKAASAMAQEAWVKESTKYLFNDEDYRNLPNLMKAFIQYLNTFHYHEGILEIVEPERVFKIRIMPTVFEMKLFPNLLPFYFTGRLDLEIRQGGRPWLFEFKTTSKKLDSQARQLHRSPQVMGYNYACRATSLLKEIPDGSQIMLHQITAYKSRTTGKYGEAKFDFHPSPEIFSVEDLALWRLGFVSDAFQLQQYCASGCFPMRHHSCYGQYGACPYVNLCEQNRPADDLILQGYFIDANPWEVTQGAHKIVEVEECDDCNPWNEIQERLAAV